MAQERPIRFLFRTHPISICKPYKSGPPHDPVSAQRHFQRKYTKNKIYGMQFKSLLQLFRNKPKKKNIFLVMQASVFSLPQRYLKIFNPFSLLSLSISIFYVAKFLSLNRSLPSPSSLLLPHVVITPFYFHYYSLLKYKLW